MTTGKKYLCIADVAALLGISRSTARRLILLKMDHFRPSQRCIRVDSETMDAYLQRNACERHTSSTGGQDLHSGRLNTPTVTSAGVSLLDSLIKSRPADSLPSVPLLRPIQPRTKPKSTGKRTH